jgi:rRNA maturation endonuclease Nob1
VSAQQVSFTTLDPKINQDRIWCVKCGGPQTFVAVMEFESGRLGFCLGCGDERVEPFTRSVSEAA